MIDSTGTYLLMQGYKELLIVLLNIIVIIGLEYLNLQEKRRPAVHAICLLVTIVAVYELLGCAGYIVEEMTYIRYMHTLKWP